MSDFDGASVEIEEEGGRTLWRAKGRTHRARRNDGPSGRSQLEKAKVTDGGFEEASWRTHPVNLVQPQCALWSAAALYSAARIQFWSMARFRIQVVLNMLDGLAENAATNTWYCLADLPGNVDTFLTDLQSFYQECDLLLSNLIDPANILMKVYDLADPEPRTPIQERLMTGITVAASAAPTEVAMVMSYQAVRSAGLPQSRRRGRIFLGPLGDNVFDATGRVPPGTQAILVTAGADLLANSIASTDYDWAQYSPTDDLMHIVADGWVDNEWDTQRRRGRKATLRSTF